MSEDTDDFTPALGCMVRPAIADLKAQLGSMPLAPRESDAICAAVTEALYETVHRKTSRVLILELNGARITGRLTSADDRGRWSEYLELAGGLDYWRALTVHYPQLMTRLDRVIGNRIRAAVALAERFTADREAIGLGELRAVTLGAGDSHRGGHAVAILACAEGNIVYKPRSVRVDATLAAFVAELLPDVPPQTRIRVPAVIERDGYGWAEHVTHRHCAGEAELAAFYHGIGHWLAVMGLLGGVDLHAENLIACGPVPVVVDCETLFMPMLPPAVSGDGEAVDLAADMIEGTVLRTGLLPGRGIVLGWRGVDTSAVGALPGQQPTWNQPVILDVGTDRARIGVEKVEVPIAANHPGEDPELSRYWGRVLAGFEELTERMRAMDRAGTLAPLVSGFGDCPTRVVARATEVYAELSRMLWHPVSLHDPEPAAAKATGLLTKMNELLPIAPSDPTVARAEVEDLLDGDIPFFATTPETGRLTGPRGTTWLPEKDLLTEALTRWRETDLGLQSRVIQATLVSAYLNEGWTPGEDALKVDRPDRSDLDRRRRGLAAGIMAQVVDSAIRGPRDATATWIAPVMDDTGWSVRPMGLDLYAGLHGVALAVAGYLGEAEAGRADPVAGLDDLLPGIMLTIRKIEDRAARQRREGLVLRPEPPGAYVGLGSHIWSWLMLERVGMPDAVERAIALAGLMPAAVRVDTAHDLLVGMAGAIPALLRLARRTGEDRWVDLAIDVGHRLEKAAILDGAGARWPGPRWPDGIGGFAHGATGIGWALGQLAAACGEERFERFAALSRAAADFEESAYDAHARGWRDLRQESGTAAAWCHGAVGIGLSTMDAEVRDRAARAAWADGMGWNHTLCHGDLGSWELLWQSPPPGLDRADLDGYVLSSLEQHGPISGLARDTFSPSLLPGLGGVAYQLLRMHPDCPLPTVLVP